MQHKQFPTDSPSSKPLVTCIYGWKRTFTLYQDRIDVDGTVYALDDLVHVRSIHRTFMNIPSVRLELRFRLQDVVLRGIAAVEDAKRVAEYLDTYCADIQHMTSSWGWKRARQSASLPPSLHTPSTTDTPTALARSPLALSVVPMSNFGAADRNMQEHALAATAPIAVPDWLRDLDAHVVYTREQQRIRANRSVRKYGFALQERIHQAEGDTLPSVAVPLRLLPQEIAHYCTNATLCNETPAAVQDQQARFTYTATDHGRLVLTSKRMIYLGRTGQLVLDYAQLTHVSRLHNAIVLSTDSWSKCYVFEMSRPLECALYLDSILHRFQPQFHAAQPVQHSVHEPALRHTHLSRTTQSRSATRQTRSVRPIKPAIELADIETLPLSLLQHVEMEVVE